MCEQRFAQVDSNAEVCGGLGITYYGVAPLLSDPQGVFLLLCSWGNFFDLRSGPLISLFQQSSASATSFVLGVSGGEHSFSVSPLDEPQLSSPGAQLSPTSG